MEQLTKKLQAQFDKMCATGKLFRVAVTGQMIWDKYLGSFINNTDPVFRDPSSSVHNCNHCNNFVRRYGNIVAIDDDYNIITLFDVDTDEEYQNSMNAMSLLIRGSIVTDVFFETLNELNSLPYESIKRNQKIFRLGIDKNHKRYTKEEAEVYGVVKANEVRTFNHMFLDLPEQFVDVSGKSIESLMADYKSAKEVFKRAMDEISLDTLLLVKDLIVQGSLLNGDTHLYKIEQMIPLMEEYQNVPSLLKDNWCWIKSFQLPIAKFKNELIGVLCSELAEGEELNKACQSWNKRVDPANYMKAVAPITENQKRQAQEFVEENGYVESFDRRLAVLDDIKADEIKHINVGDGSVKSASIFDNVKTIKSRHKRNEFEGVEEIGIDKFMSDILPSCTSVEAFLENKHENNLVTLTTSNDENAKQIFKWENPYSWTYKGNLAGKSQIKESVKSQGGKVDGVLRFSIMWSEGNSTDDSDLDAHCIEANGNEIYYSNRSSRRTGGNLDIDITNPSGHKRLKKKEVVENITYPSIEKMDDGVYKFFVHQFSERLSQGFKAEIEFDGELYEYTYDKRVMGNVHVAEVKLENGKFTINHKLPSTSSSKEMYGLTTQDFHKVNLVCLSPNHWGNNNVGNKHYFFMIDECKADSPIRSFHAENLETELAKHRKVLEVLGAVNMIEPNDNQLSGLGFNATVRDSIILRLQGNFKRVIKVNF